MADEDTFTAATATLATALGEDDAERGACRPSTWPRWPGVDALDVLLAAGADVIAESEDPRATTALHERQPGLCARAPRTGCGPAGGGRR